VAQVLDMPTYPAKWMASGGATQRLAETSALEVRDVLSASTYAA
jgi:hypothetical protein